MGRMQGAAGGRFAEKQIRIGIPFIYIIDIDIYPYGNHRVGANLRKNQESIKD